MTSCAIKAKCTDFIFAYTIGYFFRGYFFGDNFSEDIITYIRIKSNLKIFNVRSTTTLYGILCRECAYLYTWNVYIWLFNSF
jgi:hypothetical protein